MFEIVVTITGEEEAPVTMRLGLPSRAEEVQMAFSCRNKAEAHDFFEKALIAYDVAEPREAIEE